MELDNHNLDLFGNVVEKNELLRDKFIEPPFSVLDTKQGSWQRRKDMWKNLGIKSEVGRGNDNKSQIITSDGKMIGLTPKTSTIRFSEKGNDITKKPYISIFDPALCEVLYHWFCPKGGEILDPFAGGSVRGIVANYLGYRYTGIDIRQEQIDSNREQGLDILKINNQPNWYVGDSNAVLNEFINKFDFLFSCPPYADLEVYSELDGELSNMQYDDFLIAYKSIIKKSCSLLKKDSYACFVVGEVRDKGGNYYGFVPDTIKIFQEVGMEFYNEAILLNAIASASMRANGNMRSKKLVKVHQNILIFKKTIKE